MKKIVYLAVAITLTGAFRPGATAGVSSGEEAGEDFDTPASQPVARRYADAVAKLEEVHTPYDSVLSEHLVSLGLEQQAHGRHANALDAFKRALHVTRINEGLYTLHQEPIVERMLDSLAAEGLWNDAHRQLDYLYWLNKRNYGASDPRMLPIIERMAVWHLQAYTARLGVRMYKRLLTAQELDAKAVEIIEGHYGKQDRRLIDVLKRVQLTNYYLATYSGEPSDEDIEVTISINGSAPNEPNEYERIKLLDLMDSSYATGREALERLGGIYRAYPEFDQEARLGAQVALGDWYLVFGKKRKALAVYEDVYRQLEESDDIGSPWFGEPQPLPEAAGRRTVEQGDAFDSERGDVPYVLASFDVDRWGKVRDIEVLDATGARRDQNSYRIQRWLRNTRFRPRFERGEPVLTEDLLRRFRFYEDARGVKITKVDVGAG